MPRRRRRTDWTVRARHTGLKIFLDTPAGDFLAATIIVDLEEEISRLKAMKPRTIGEEIERERFLKTARAEHERLLAAYKRRPRGVRQA